MERGPSGKLTHYLGYGKHDPTGRVSGNSRNEHSNKTLLIEVAFQ